jgi:hypothetical protein
MSSQGTYKNSYAEYRWNKGNSLQDGNILLFAHYLMKIFE